MSWYCYSIGVVCLSNVDKVIDVMEYMLDKNVAVETVTINKHTDDRMSSVRIKKVTRDDEGRLKFEGVEVVAYTDITSDVCAGETPNFTLENRQWITFDGTPVGTEEHKIRCPEEIVRFFEARSGFSIKSASKN